MQHNLRRDLRVAAEIVLVHTDLGHVIEEFSSMGQR